MGNEEKYQSHTDYLEAVRPYADERQARIETALREAFKNYLRRQTVEVILLSSITAEDLAKAFEAFPVIVKPILAACNLAARAVERDLGLRNFDTYEPRFREGQAAILAGYVKPHLPASLELPGLALLDRTAFIDKEMRKSKGHWEKLVCAAANAHDPSRYYKKTHFVVNGERFELDAACRDAGGNIITGIDVKRIEARRDIHKRCDEIVNKAVKLKAAFPGAKFGVVVYYPFVEEQVNIQSRLTSPSIDGIMFASSLEESVKRAVRLLLDKFREGHP